jgi:hypothetical protein
MVMQGPVFISRTILMPYICWSSVRDATTVRMTHTCGGSCGGLIITSAYLSYDSDKPPPTGEQRNVIDYCCSRKKQHTIGCDANAHHVLWGSTGTNPRGEASWNIWRVQT